MVDEPSALLSEPTPAEPEPKMSNDELWEIQKAFERDLGAFSKTTFVQYLALCTIWDAWFFNGNRAAITAAREKLIAELKKQAPFARDTNRFKRFESAMERIGRGELPKKRKARKRRKVAP
ncbi:hypothetical protein [Telmatospirillum sp.]|uniref:hypothetical protein n=1 Tax=Telmatospirillum sp. TaxID=2079197 RepID=UPI0028461350|nr:hypothetical protein [Telmatospirillum sp.]MDR3437153.1 hypothetical protein [Telmatospirillum sp.]